MDWSALHDVAQAADIIAQRAYAKLLSRDQQLKSEIEDIRIQLMSVLSAENYDLHQLAQLDAWATLQRQQIRQLTQDRLAIKVELEKAKRAAAVAFGKKLVVNELRNQPC